MRTLHRTEIVDMPHRWRGSGVRGWQQEIHALWCGWDIMGRDRARVEGKGWSDVFHRKEYERMMRQWLKILVLVLTLLSQMAMSCQSGGQQSSGSTSPESPPSSRGGY